MSSLDRDYITRVAEQAADALRTGRTFVLGYEPQNMTRYEIALVPLDESTTTDVTASQLPVLGIGDLDGRYVLVAVISRGCYAFDMRSLPVPSYIAEKLSLSPADGEAIWVLLRAIGKE